MVAFPVSFPIQNGQRLVNLLFTLMQSFLSTTIRFMTPAPAPWLSFLFPTASHSFAML